MPYPGGADLTIEDSSGDYELSLNWLKDGRLALAVIARYFSDTAEINITPPQIERIAAAFVEGMKDAAKSCGFTALIFQQSTGHCRDAGLFRAHQVGALRAMTAAIVDAHERGALGEAAKLALEAAEISRFDFDKSKAAPPPGDGGNGAGSAQDAGAPAAAKL